MCATIACRSTRHGARTCCARRSAGWTAWRPRAATLPYSVPTTSSCAMRTCSRARRRSCSGYARSSVWISSRRCSRSPSPRSTGATRAAPPGSSPKTAASSAPRCPRERCRASRSWRAPRCSPAVMRSLCRCARPGACPGGARASHSSPMHCSWCGRTRAAGDTGGWRYSTCAISSPRAVERVAQALSRAVQALEQRRYPVAEGGGLGFGGCRVVWHAQEIDAPLQRVQHGALGKLFLALARGIHGSGIDKIKQPRVQRHGRLAGQLAHAFALHLVDALLVAVAEEAQPRIGEIRPQEGRVLLDVLRRAQVLLHVAYAAVDQHHALVGNAIGRQRGEVGQALRGERPARALQRVHRLAGAAGKIQPPQADEIVVAGDRQRAALAHHGDALVRVGVIADDVAQAQQTCHLPALEGSQGGGEGLPVAMDVGYEAVKSHRRSARRSRGRRDLRTWNSLSKNGSGSRQANSWYTFGAAASDASQPASRSSPRAAASR